MNLFNEWHTKDETMQFVERSIPDENGNIRLYESKEDAGWVALYFRYNKSEFEVFVTLATNNLYDLVVFFENIINLKEDAAIYLDNELISVPLLYVSPVDNQKIRFFVADCKRVHDLWKEGKLPYDYDRLNLSNYDIRCDVIAEKKKLLKEFYRAIKNIINNCTIYEEHIYDIGYLFWKNNLKNIINYVKK